MIRRFDIGWRTAGGDHGLIAARDGPLTPEESNALMPLTDVTGAFRPFWIVLTLSGDTLAVGRVAPVPGGTRGQASTSQILLLSLRSRPWGAMLDDLPYLIPPPPSNVGEASEWPEMATSGLYAAPNSVAIDALQEAHMPERQVLGRLLAAPVQLKEDVEISTTADLTPAGQVEAVLKAFAVLPRTRQARRLAFVTLEAPTSLPSPCFRLIHGTREAVQVSTADAYATLWLHCIRLFSELPSLLAEASFSSPRSLIAWMCVTLEQTHSQPAPTIVREVLGDRLDLGPLQAQRLPAVEQFLTGLDVARAGRMRHAIATCITSGDFAMELKQWAVRLVLDESVFKQVPDVLLRTPEERSGLWNAAFRLAPDALAVAFVHLTQGEKVRLYMCVATAALEPGEKSSDQLKLIRLVDDDIHTSLQNNELLYAKYGEHYRTARRLLQSAQALGKAQEHGLFASNDAEALALYNAAERTLSRPTSGTGVDNRMLGAADWRGRLTERLARTRPASLMAQIQSLVRANGSRSAEVVFGAIERATPVASRLFLPHLKAAVAQLDQHSTRQNRS